MAHFAKIENGIVTHVIAAEQDFIDSGLVGDVTTWIKTSYNTRGGVHYVAENDSSKPAFTTPSGQPALRANYASIGYTYDSVNDVFYAPRPYDRNGVLCESWTVSAPDWLWTPPIPRPDFDINYLDSWDEPTQTWIRIVSSIGRKKGLT